MSKEASARWRAAHPEKSRAVNRRTQAQYRVANPEKVKAGIAAWHNAHPEKTKEAIAKWQAAHPEKLRASSQRRRVALRNGVVEQFIDIEIFERDDWICGLCDGPIDRDLAWPDPWSVSLDHILPITLGGHHTRSNVQAAHLHCNISKGNRACVGVRVVR